MATTGEKKSRASAPPGLAFYYLIAYNVAQFFGWSWILVLTVRHLVATGTHAGLWHTVEIWLKIFQTAAILEVVHSVVKIVQANPVMTLFQIFSRVLVVWGIADCVVASQNAIGIPLLLFTWTITEMVRYSFYFLNLMSLVPSFLVWCRYTFFYVLYPMGVTGELICMFVALPYLKESGLYSLALPNRANVSFNYHYVIILIMLSYIPVFPQLYFHMIRQRKKVLGPKKIE